MLRVAFAPLIQCSMEESFQSDNGVSGSILLSLKNCTKGDQKSSGCEHLLKVSKMYFFHLDITENILRAGYLYIYELDTSLFPFFTMCVIDADTTVNCSDPYSLTIEMRRGDAGKEIRKDFLVIFVDILGEALRAEQLILSSNNCKVNLSQTFNIFSQILSRITRWK